MAQSRPKTSELAGQVDALADALASTDPATRKALMSRLTHALELRMRPRAAPDPCSRTIAPDDADDPAELLFDNLPV